MLEYILNHKKKILIFFLLLALFVSIYIITIYFYRFNNFSNNPQDWAAFGSYMSGTLNVIAVFVNILISLVIAISLNDLSKDNTQRQTRTAKQIAIIQLRNEVYKNFIERMNPLYRNWNDNRNNITDAKKCIDYLEEFKLFNSHLFTFDKITTYSQMISQIENSIYFLKKDDLVSFEGEFSRFQNTLNKTYQEMSSHVIDIIN